MQRGILFTLDLQFYNMKICFLYPWEVEIRAGEVTWALWVAGSCSSLALMEIWSLWAAWIPEMASQIL